jgi:hypothetical protein
MQEMELFPLVKLCAVIYWIVIVIGNLLTVRQSY